MADRGPRSPLALIVLWLLWDGPKHPYGMQKLIEQQGKHRVVNVRSRASLYQAIERLVRLGFAEVVETVREASRPERTMYAITDAGRTAAREWLREMLRRTGAEFPEFVAAISILFGLEPDDAREQLEIRVAALDAELAQAEAELTDNPRLPRLFLLEEEYRRAVLRAETKWLRGVIADIRSGELTWSEEWLRQIAAAVLAPADDQEGDTT